MSAMSAAAFCRFRTSSRNLVLRSAMTATSHRKLPDVFPQEKRQIRIIPDHCSSHGALATAVPRLKPGSSECVAAQNCLQVGVGSLQSAVRKASHTESYHGWMHWDVGKIWKVIQSAAACSALDTCLKSCGRQAVEECLDPSIGKT
jgi:hypothetical protein